MRLLVGNGKRYSKRMDPSQNDCVNKYSLKGIDIIIEICRQPRRVKNTSIALKCCEIARDYRNVNDINFFWTAGFSNRNELHEHEE